jgi:Tetratricopeptide repeat
MLPPHPHASVLRMKLRLLLGLVVVLALAQLAFFSRFAVDDAYISFRYARNLAQGHGLVFNVGERVEGFTNFSFTVLTAPAFWLGVDPLLWARGLSLAALMGVFIVTWRIAGLYLRDPVTRALPLLLLALSPGLFYWSMAGLETVVFAFALLWVLYLELAGASGPVYPLAHLFLVTTRPEGFLASGLIGLHRLWRDRRLEPRLWAPYAAGVLLYLGGKWMYYGQLVPNTFIAKVTGAEHSHQTLQFLTDHPVTLVGGLGMLLAWRSDLLLPAVLFGAYLLVPELLGGDGMPYYRFFVHLLPLGALGAVLGASRPHPRLVRTFVWLTVAGTLAWSLALYPFRIVPALHYTNRVVTLGRIAGEWVRAHTAPGDRIAVNAAGALPFYAQRPCIDMLGLCDSVIARSDPAGFTPIGAVGPGHSKGDGAYVFRRRPDLIVFGNSAGSRDPLYVSDQQLARLDAFATTYAFRTAALTEPRRTSRFVQLDRSRAFAPVDRFGESLKPGLYVARFDGLGMDMSLDYSRTPARGEVFTYPATFAFYARNDHALARWRSTQSFLPPPPVPEEFYTAQELQYAGAYHASLGEYARALQLFERSLAQADHFSTHYLMGRVYLEMGKSEDAKRELREALRRNPALREAADLLTQLEAGAAPARENQAPPARH